MNTLYIKQTHSITNTHGSKAHISKVGSGKELFKLEFVAQMRGGNLGL